ncbi:UNVERIFIED_CONTAM: hypothetical protein GTU68_008301 [Idotea baltica]|nr:hypothetical protein [Idotea baltica]
MYVRPRFRSPYS